MEEELLMGFGEHYTAPVCSLYDDKQLGFYLSRNIKTVGLLSVLGIVVISFFRLFWESLNLFINNIL